MIGYCKSIRNFKASFKKTTIKRINKESLILYGTQRRAASEKRMYDKLIEILTCNDDKRCNRRQSAITRTSTLDKCFLKADLSSTRKIPKLRYFNDTIIITNELMQRQKMGRNKIQKPKLTDFPLQNSVIVN